MNTFALDTLGRAAALARQPASAMDKLVIEGGARLAGTIAVSGAKNAALPILCASLLTPEPLRLTNVPQLNDVRTMRTLLTQMGVAQDGSDGNVTLEAIHIDWPLAPYELVQDDARVDPGARAAGRALRRGARVAARRLRDRPASRRPAREGPGGDGRGDLARARLHRGTRRSDFAARASRSTW